MLVGSLLCTFSTSTKKVKSHSQTSLVKKRIKYIRLNSYFFDVTYPVFSRPKYFFQTKAKILLLQKSNMRKNI